MDFLRYRGGRDSIDDEPWGLVPFHQLVFVGIGWSHSVNFVVRVMDFGMNIPGGGVSIASPGGFGIFLSPRAIFGIPVCPFRTQKPGSV